MSQLHNVFNYFLKKKTLKPARGKLITERWSQSHLNITYDGFVSCCVRVLLTKSDSWVSSLINEIPLEWIIADLMKVVWNKDLHLAADSSEKKKIVSGLTDLNNLEQKDCSFFFFFTILPTFTERVLSWICFFVRKHRSFEKVCMFWWWCRVNPVSPVALTSQIFLLLRSL